MSSSLKRCVAVAVLFACAAGSGFTLSVEAQQSRTVNQGVYTEEQARQGQALYKEQCASCHGATLAGVAGPPLTGDDFLAAWDKQPLSDLFGKVRNTMPQNAPGKLSGQQAAEIVAYILQTSKFPAGRAALPAEDAALQQIGWPARSTAPARPAVAQGPAFPPAGNLAQVMRGILFPSSNIIFTVQTHDPGEKKTTPDAGTAADGGFNWMVWGGSIYSGWELVDYAAIALAESAPLMLTPGRRCENGRPVPVTDPDWIKFTNELAEAGKAAYKASQSRNQELVSDISNQVADSCSNCHQAYRDKRRPGVDPIDPSNKANRCVK